MYRVIVHRRAVRYLQRLPKSQKKKIKNIISKLRHHPLEFSGVKHMVGDWAGYHRIRIGDKRIIFWVDKVEYTV